MAPRKTGVSGPFPYPTQASWADDLYEAVVQTCQLEGVTPAPRAAIMQALAPALGAGEAKRVIEKRRDGSRLLRPSAYHVHHRGTDQALVLLNVGLHGAATLPWSLNDRTRSRWLHPSADNIARLKQLVDQEAATIAAKAALQRAREDQRRLAATASPAEKAAAAAAVADAEKAVEDAAAILEQHQQALGQLRPLPMVRTATENGAPVAALAAAPASVGLARSIQQYTVEQLRAIGRVRSYDLLESMVLEGQREDTVVVLQVSPLINADGSTTEVWRAYQVTGNNRADARLQIFGLDAADLLIGVPQPRLLIDGEAPNPRLLIQGLAEILRRVSIRLNDEYADANHDPEGLAERAWRVAQVPARVVVGAAQPERLEAALRELNVHDHLRGQLVYDDTNRSLGLFSTLMQAYQEKNLLTALLAGEVTGGRLTAGQLDASGIADALVGAGPLDPLAALLHPGEQVTSMSLRDVAIRCITVLVFPPIPQPPAKLAPYSRMPLGRYWPVVREAMQESAWSQESGAKTRRRTEVWAAAIRQLFAHRGNLLALDGAFTAHQLKYGIRPDARSLTTLLAECQAGNTDAWTILVRQHLLPGLVNAPEKFITPGQGSEKGPDRKGVRRTPSNAIGALISAYTTPALGVTRDLLIAFAEAVLAAPDMTTGVGGHPAGTFWAPDENGQPQPGTLADKTWYDLHFPKVAPAVSGQPEPESGDTDTDPDDDDPDITELPEDLPEDPHLRMIRLRADVPTEIAAVRQQADALAEELDRLVSLVQDAVTARQDAGAAELPVEAQKAYVNEIKNIKTGLDTRLDQASAAVMGL